MGKEARLPVALEQLRDEWERRDLRPPDVGQQLRPKADRRTAGERVRSWLAGKNRITLDEAEQLAARIDARIVLTSEDPLTHLEAAIASLPKDAYSQLRRHLGAIVRDERATAAQRPKARAAASSR